MVVDPAVADPVLAEASARGWPITAIWNTHWHPDHTGGNADIKAKTGCEIIAPAAERERIPTADRLVSGGDRVRLGAHVADVWDVPAHTAGHIAYHFADDGAIFVGDTLFAMGCGRLFEGTAEQMFANMQRLGTLGDATRRSEEHTSELQSLMRISYAVFCLKKKTKNTKNDRERNSKTQYQ